MSGMKTKASGQMRSSGTKSRAEKGKLAVQARIGLAHGSGGLEMLGLIKRLGINFRGRWKNCLNDSATLACCGKMLFFTSDSYVVEPVFFPGGDIGCLAVYGTINDLAVMGARPIGISLSLVIEEGMTEKALMRIISSIRKASKLTGVPVATGDTKVVERGRIGSLMINTSGLGLGSKGAVLDGKAVPGDSVIVSGGIGEHSVAVLSKRFGYSSRLKSDSKPLIDEIEAVRNLIKSAKDITRGGLASCLNEIADSSSAGFLIDELRIPSRKEVRKVAGMLGVSPYELACEGRFACVAPKKNSEKVVARLKRFNSQACKIGEVVRGRGVIMQGLLGKRRLDYPSGRLVPRIC